MANYPSLAFNQATQFVPRPSLHPDVGADGTVRSRVMTDKEVFDVTLVHELLTLAEKDSLLAFYTANRTIETTVSFAGMSYKLYFNGRPVTQLRAGSQTLWTARVSMVGGLSA